MTVPRLAFVLVILASGGWLAVATAGSARAQGSFPSPDPSGTTVGVPTPIPSVTPIVEPTSQPGSITNPISPANEQCDSQGFAETNAVGLQSLLALPCLRGFNSPTLYEKYPTSAYQLHSSTGDWLQSLRNALAGWLLDWITGLGALCAALLEWVFALELTGGLNSHLNASGMLNGVVQGLNNGLYKPFSIAAVTVAGLYVLWFGVLKRKMTVTVESAGWVLLAMSVAAFFFAAPSWAVGSLDEISLIASQQILGAVSQVDPDLSNSQFHAVYANDPQKNQFSGLRAAINRYWDVYVYKPWEAAEFGSIGFADQKAPNGMTWAQWDLQSNTQGDQAKQDFQNAVDQHLTTTNQAQLKDWYDGNQSSSRVAMMGLAFIAALLADILLVIVAGAVIVSQLGLVLLTMVAPLFFLVGIHPGTGRRIFIRWAELMLGFLARRILYAAFLAVLLVFGGLIVSGVGDVSWLLASALQIGLVAAALAFRKPIANVFSQVGAGKLDHYIAPYREGAWSRVKTAVMGEQVDKPTLVTLNPFSMDTPKRRGGLFGAREEKAGAVESRKFQQTADSKQDADTSAPQPAAESPGEAAAAGASQSAGGGESDERRFPDQERLRQRQRDREKAKELGAGIVVAGAASGGAAAGAAAGRAVVDAGKDRIDQARERIDEGKERVVDMVIPHDPNRGGKPPRPKTSDDWDEIRSRARPGLLEDGDE